MTDVPTMPRHEITTLLALMRALRHPDNGCPWDIEQTFESIAPYTIEEAYEVADAIEADDLPALRDELGDLLLQVVYHSQMAAEAGAFSFDDVVTAINDKMIRRHPHVFGSPEQRQSKPQKGFWERQKAEERKQQARAADKRILDDVPTALPALSRAAKLQALAARHNFDWPGIDGVLSKIAEELQELHEARHNGSVEDMAGEFGDLLFVMANFARHNEIDPEAALRRTNAKFKARFAYIEDTLAKSGKVPGDCELEELDRLWDEAKAAGIG